MLNTRSPLPRSFLKQLQTLEQCYLDESDPIRQSGFAGGAERWRAEREPLLEGVHRSGSFLDVGCANGHLLECVMQWAAERQITLEPHGLDAGDGLIQIARERLKLPAASLICCNAWNWSPERSYDFVYTLVDCVPVERLEVYLKRLLRRAVTPGGRLIVGAYGSRSRQRAPFPIDQFLRDHGLAVLGVSHGGDPEVTRFAWVERGEGEVF
ncbi:MAG: class I SAM-dependent methyltransferase [Candidatus Cloacimonetes bacterium]|nr:class I SAM-dependent methyltransferase [Candidatus Cloacimonadota bacterium]